MDCLNNRASEERIRRLVDRLISQTIKCDGTSPQAIRKWFEEKYLTIHRTGAETYTIEIASQMRGSLPREVELYIRQRVQDVHNPNPRDQIVWNDMKMYITTAFLAVDEAAYLCDELNKLHQSPYESVTSHNRRFCDVTTIAYQPPNNADQVHIMLGNDGVLGLFCEHCLG